MRNSLWYILKTPKLRLDASHLRFAAAVLWPFRLSRRTCDLWKSVTWGMEKSHYFLLWEPSKPDCLNRIMATINNMTKVGLYCFFPPNYNNLSFLSIFISIAAFTQTNQMLNAHFMVNPTLSKTNNFKQHESIYFFYVDWFCLILLLRLLAVFVIGLM